MALLNALHPENGCNLPSIATTDATDVNPTWGLITARDIWFHSFVISHGIPNPSDVRAASRPGWLQRIFLATVSIIVGLADLGFGSRCISVYQVLGEQVEMPRRCVSEGVVDQSLALATVLED